MSDNAAKSVADKSKDIASSAGEKTADQTVVDTSKNVASAAAEKIIDAAQTDSAVDFAVNCIKARELEERFRVEMRAKTIKGACIVLCEAGYGMDAKEVQKLKKKEWGELMIVVQKSIHAAKSVADKSNDIASSAADKTAGADHTIVDDAQTVSAADFAFNCIRARKLEERFRVEMRAETIKGASIVLCEAGYEMDAEEIHKLKKKEGEEKRSMMATPNIANAAKSVTEKSKDIASSAADKSGDFADAVQDLAKSDAAKRAGGSERGDMIKKFKEAGGKQ